jgi:hypothetical protein
VNLFPVSRSGSAGDNHIDSKDHFAGFTGRNEGLLLDLKALEDAEFLHVTDAAVIDVNTGGVIAIVDGVSEVGNEFGGVKSGVVSNDGRELLKGAGERLNGDGFLSFFAEGELLDFQSHAHFSVASSVNDIVRLNWKNKEKKD